ncbi:ABC transporter substrate-binding protein [Aggregatibacter actinomycetemcomitans]|uniref:ABC transporter substrate-binding protein n=1 Tax=Aggregatibacter actinomycetemcomitans TaxID=714 RepID=UPI00197BBF78|nr:ABC transporter substrate-binding protein [Aggregatibacter actinomycetemcomitans]MBN6064147.1 ABC transporter substrate-binding protein [Aggregatibacter actinomycetemcomitans]MBN6083990.1 ABC transporter substrate-binding protein [Aggregatibacter actinomycetemcomitans]
MQKWFKRSLGLVCLSPFFFAQQVQAEGRLTVYCTVQNKVCEKVTRDFGAKYHVETQFVHGGTETIFGKIKAEKDNPQADFWYGGTIEPHFQAGELGLLEAYRSPKQAEILPQFKTLMAEKGEFTSVAYMLVLGFGVNTQKLAQLGLPTPQTWEDLLKPEYKGEIQLPDPRASGTTYTIMATLIQLWGEEKAFDYLKKLNENVSQYVKSNLVTANLSRGETAISIGFVHSYATEKEKGAPVEAVIPQGKTGYALGGASIIKGARNLDNAKLFMDYVLSKEVEEIPWREFGLYQIPTNVNAEASPKSVNPKTLQLLDFDFVKFGSSEEGKRLINKWLAEIKLAK